MGRKIAAFFTALNRPASHLLVLLSFSETIARGEGENYTVYNYYWQFFGNDSNLRQERKKNSIKILIHVNSVDPWMHADQRRRARVIVFIVRGQ